MVAPLLDPRLALLRVVLEGCYGGPGSYGGHMSETVFTYAAPALKFGSGASAELGHDLAALGARRILLVTDPGVAATGHPERIAE